MSSLKEIKDHIASVKSTMKITSAMKLVSATRLRKAEQTFRSASLYEERLHSIISQLGQCSLPSEFLDHETERRVTVLAFSSNTSLCGAFNSNIVKWAVKRIQELKGEGKEVEIIALGRKMAEMLKRQGFEVQDRSELIGADSTRIASFCEELTKKFLGGETDRIELLYNHFVSAATQNPMTEILFPVVKSEKKDAYDLEADSVEWILEPDKETLFATLIPQALRQRLLSVFRDSEVAEHAARTMAMQIATDNAEDIISSLTREYNKGRQQKITSELLDIVGGSQQ